jgi:hypothetical protein
VTPPFSMISLVFVTSLVLQPLILFGQSGHNDQWLSSDELEKNLDDYSAISAFRLRTPKDYKRLELKAAPKGTEVAVWGGPQRDDGTASVIQINVVQMPENERISKLEDLMETVLKDLRSKRTSWKQSDFRLGKINGISFLRADWVGMAANSDRKLRGIVLVGLHDNRAIALKTQEVEPYHEQGLAISLNSLLTLQTKP